MSQEAYNRGLALVKNPRRLFSKAIQDAVLTPPAKPMDGTLQKILSKALTRGRFKDNSMDLQKTSSGNYRKSSSALGVKKASADSFKDMTKPEMRQMLVDTGVQISNNASKAELLEKMVSRANSRLENKNTEQDDELELLDSDDDGWVTD